MNFIKVFWAFLLAVGLSQLAIQTTMASEKRVLMVVSSHGMDKGKTQPGYEFGEFAQAYLIFKQNNIAVDVASPRGGKVEADQYKASLTFNRQVLDDPDIMVKLTNTLPMNSVSSEKYDAIFIVGGKGAMFDLPENTALQEVIAQIYRKKGSIAAVCHGPAALTNVRLEDGSYLVAGKTVNSFTNEEENIFGQKWLPKYKFLLEDRLKQRGAIFENSPMMMSHVAVDDRLITGQNPASTPVVAEALVRSLGIEPRARQPFQDELTLNLIAKLLKRDKTAAQMYRTTPKKYNARLIGMYGYYQALYAKSNPQTKLALSVMALVARDVDSPKLDMAMAKGYHKIGQAETAKTILENIIQQHPDFTAARDMLQAL